MLTRRAFLRAGTAGTVAIAAFTNESLARVARAAERTHGQTAADIASDENYWREIQEAFTLDRTLINLNNGGCCPSPRVVHEAIKRYLDISNQAPVYHMWQVLEPNIESVRRRLAAEFGCDAEELAITRNASEALQIAQLGIDLKPGDEVVTTNQDYGRMLDTWDQRARRDGIVAQEDFVPGAAAAPAELARRLLAAVTPRDEGPPLLPHHEPDGPDLPCARRSARRRARQGHHDHRRRRSRVRALPVHALGARMRLLRHEPAQVAARANRDRVSVRPPRADRVALAVDARRRLEVRRTSASSRRSAPIRPRTTTRSPRR